MAQSHNFYVDSGTVPNTPAGTSNQNQNGFSGVSAISKSLFHKENLNTVSSVIGDKFSAMRRQAENGNHSLQFMGILGGLLLIVVSCMELVGKLLSFHFAGVVIEFFSFVVGVIIIILESRNIMMTENIQAQLFKYCLFLKFLWGRGLLYFFVGTLQLYQLDVWSFIAGGYMCFIGVLMFFVGQRTAYKLKNMRRSLYSREELQQKFAQNDLDGDGGLDIQQFAMLTNHLGLDMNKRESEAAFAHMKKDKSTDKLSYEEFHSWWISTEVEETIDSNSLSFV